MFALAVLLTLSQAADAEVFVDHSQVYVREGERAGLRAGNVVELLDARGAVIGKARVAEAFEALARLDLDQKSPMAKAKRARFGGISEPPLVDTTGSVVTDSKRPEDLDREQRGGVPYQGDVTAEREEAGPGLDGGSPGMLGSASVNGFGALKRITVRNDSKFDWHACEVRLPTNKRYRLGTLAAESSEAIMWFRFDQDGVERDLPIDSVLMKCSEGWARFSFDL